MVRKAVHRDALGAACRRLVPRLSLLLLASALLLSACSNGDLDRPQETGAGIDDLKRSPCAKPANLASGVVAPVMIDASWRGRSAGQAGRTIEVRTCVVVPAVPGFIEL